MRPSPGRTRRDFGPRLRAPKRTRGAEPSRRRGVHADRVQVDWMFVRAVGSASRRSGSMGSPVTSSTPYVPSSRRCRRGLDLGQVHLEPFEDGEVLLALEELRTLIGRMLVVVRQISRLRRLLLVETLAPQLRDQLAHALRSRSSRSRAAPSSNCSVMREGYPSGADASLAQVEARAEVDEAVGDQLAEQLQTGARVAGREHPLRVEWTDRRERRRFVRRARQDRRRASAVRRRGDRCAAPVR